MVRIIDMQKDLANSKHYTYQEYDKDDQDPFGEKRDPLYLLSNNDFFLIDSQSELNRWRVLEGAYTADMRVLFAGSWDRLSANDVRAVVFPWAEEVREFYLQNCPGAICSFTTVIKPIALPEASMQDRLQHGVAFNFEANGRPLLDDEDYVLPFKNRAADLGNRCPPRCRDYYSPV